MTSLVRHGLKLFVSLPLTPPAQAGSGCQKINVDTLEAARLLCKSAKKTSFSCAALQPGPKMMEEAAYQPA